MRKTGTLPKNQTVFFSTDTPNENNNLTLQGFLIAAERRFTSQRRSNAKKHASLWSGTPHDPVPVTDDGLHLRMMLLERQHLQLLAAQRMSKQHFLGFLEPFDLQTLGEFRSANGKLFEQIEAQFFKNPEKALELLKLNQEYGLWILQTRIVELGRRLNTIAPRYGFSEYSAIRATVIEEGCRYIGRAMHIAARLALHHPEIPISWERCLHVFHVGHGGFDPPYTLDDYMMEKSVPSWTLKSQKQVAQGTKKKSYLSQRTLAEMLKHFKPVAHILAAMDVLACRPYLPISPPDDLWPPYSPVHEPDIGFLKAGRSFMDDPRNHDMTLATLGYAMWFQDWGLKKSSSRGSRALLNEADIQMLQSDLPLPQVIEQEIDVIQEDGSIVRREPLADYPYTPSLRADLAEYWRDSSGIVGGDVPFAVSPDVKPGTVPLPVSPDADEVEKAGRVYPPHLILPPLPQKVLDVVRNYKPKHSRKR